MFLMDQVMEWAGKVKDNRNRHNPALKPYTDMAEKLVGTPRFLLDRAAIHTAVELSLGRPKVLREAMQHLRVPYERMWIEWEEAGREKLRRTFDNIPIETPDRPLPKSLGFLIEADPDGRKGQVTWAWSLNNDQFPPNLAPISAYFDLDNETPQSQLRIEGFLRGNLVRLWKDNPVQLEALFSIWRTADHRPSDWGIRMFESMVEHHDMTKEQITNAIANAYSDVYGEYIIIWSVLLLLTSSKKIVDYQEVDRKKVNRLRKLRNKTSLLDHTQVILHIGQHEQTGQRRMPLGYTRKSPRIHMVSSYLARRGNLHWIVAPYFRGSGETISRHVHMRG